MTTGRRERKKQELRERILDAAAGLIAEQGLPATTVDHIAERADIAQTTFFNYFRTRAALVDALVERLVDLFEIFLDQDRSPGGRVAQRIDVLYRVSAELPPDQHRVLHDVVADAVRSPSGAPARSLTRLREQFAADIAAAQAAGEVRGDRGAGALTDAILGIFVSAVLFAAADPGLPVGDRLLATVELASDLVGVRSTDPVPST